jgi:beta-lactam-binding protein with PASTA domain
MTLKNTLQRIDYRHVTKLTGIALGVIIFVFFVIDDLIMPQYVQQGKSTKVPMVVGMTAEQAKQILAEAGLVARESETRIDKQYPIGTVALQNPPAGSEVKFGRGVYLTLSGGEPLVIVPSLRGRSLREAVFTLERTALTLGKVQYEVSEEFPENTVISQEIPESTKVKNGSKINVAVSQGRTSNKLPVPNVTEKSLAEAERILTQAGFRVGTITYQINLDLLPNTVIEQYPKFGELLTLDQPINLFVSQKGEKKTTTEN